MGCFNAACSISNLSIGHGDKVVFIPLVPVKTYDQNKGYLPYRKLEPAHMLTYSNCFYNPFSFPIEGEYNDYGGVENIKKDHNTKAIEKYFGITIDQFLDCVTSNREWHDYFSGYHTTYATNPKLLSSYDIPFDEKFLKKLGFEKQKSGGFLFKNEKIKKHLEVFIGLPPPPKTKSRDDPGFEIKDQAGASLYKTHDHEWQSKEKLHEVFHELTGWYLGVAPENQERVRVITQLSGMFVLKDIYDALSKNNSSENWGRDRFCNTVAASNVTAMVLDALSFKKEKRAKSPRYKDRDADFYSRKGTEATVAFDGWGADVVLGKKTETAYSVRDFKTEWEKMTGQELDITPFETMYKSDLDFDAHREALLEREKLENGEIKGKIDMELQRKLWRLLDLTGRDCFGSAFKDWEYFDDLYSDVIKKGHLKEEIRWFRMFMTSMYSCNRFFFPAMNGEQHGNDEESLNLLNASIKFIKDRQKRHGDYDGEGEEASL